ncbi:MAG TPA: hypothetical protein ENG62_02815 [Thermoplasmatales archaeon]|nr:hypothetical protein [Thermoplasmatales archaeon]
MCTWKIPVSLILIVTLYFSLIGSSISSFVIDRDVIYVDKGNLRGPWDGSISHPYRSIQDALNKAVDGDVIYVFSGRYNGSIMVDKKVTLIGESRDSTILDGCFNSSVLFILADDVRVEGFTIENSGGEDASIYISADNTSISNCCIYCSRYGVLSDNGCRGLRIYQCIFYRNGEGVTLRLSSNILVMNSSFMRNSIAVNIESCKGVYVEDSYFSHNGISIHSYSSNQIILKGCLLVDNCVNKGGVFLVECRDILVSQSNLTHNGVGVSISNSSDILVDHCTVTRNTHYGFSLRKPSYNISIEYSLIKDNMRCGVYVEKGNTCNLYLNHIVNNTLYGLYVWRANCIARFNWWGSPLGPRKPIYGSRLWSHRYIQFIPWLIQPLKVIGSNIELGDLEVDEPHVCVEREFSFNGVDSDGDGVPDWWEEKWGYNPYNWDDHYNLDPDDDGLNNVEECYTDEYGSNPFHKDIFLEIDWCSSVSKDLNEEFYRLMDSIKRVFEEHGITLHVDLGGMGGGEEIPRLEFSQYSYSLLPHLYWKYFLHEDPLNPRKGVFHYGIVCSYCPDVNFPFIGWDNLDSFAISVEWLHSFHPFVPRERIIVGAILHHLGHTMGLTADLYGGIDNLDTLKVFSLEWWRYINYRSCMNYFYKFKILSFSDGSSGRGDFDDWSHLDFSFFKHSVFRT